MTARLSPIIVNFLKHLRSKAKLTVHNHTNQWGLSLITSSLLYQPKQSDIWVSESLTRQRPVTILFLVIHNTQLHAYSSYPYQQNASTPYGWLSHCLNNYFIRSLIRGLDTGQIRPIPKPKNVIMQISFVCFDRLI